MHAQLTHFATISLDVEIFSHIKEMQRLMYSFDNIDFELKLLYIYVYKLTENMMQVDNLKNYP